jgi:hypothetical protein
MTEKSISKSAVMMLIIVIVAVSSYEMYLRGIGAEMTYDDGPELWSDKRAMVYAPSDKQVVFIGSSRIKYDLDIPTWEVQTGLKAIQLAMVGSTPRPMLEDLANDSAFKGKLIVDITEPLFFLDLPPYHESPGKGIKYFHNRTPAQRAGFELNKILESQFVFLDKDYFSMNAQLDRIAPPSRPGIFVMPPFPLGFENTQFDRQSYMTDSFAKDPARVGAVQQIWGMLLKGPMPPPMTDKQIHETLLAIKASTDKIKSRGGQVLFVRTPSSGPFRAGEKMGFPREKYWNKLLEVTNCEGIHFEDFPETAGFICPEFSHLNHSDAKLYTERFIKILSTHKNWEVQSTKLLTKL